MSTIQPSPDHSKPRLRGEMYLRAEQRKREEMAADDPGTDGLTASTPVAPATEILTSSPDATTTVVPAALDLIETVAIEAPAAKRPPRPLAHRRQTLMPAATLAAVAIIATLGLALTLSPSETSEEPRTPAAVTTLAATPAPAVTPGPAAAPAKMASAPATTPAPAASTPSASPRAKPVKNPAKPAVAPATRTTAAVGKTATASRALDGQLRITSLPAGARVTVDGIGWGQTPLTVGHLPFGTKTVRLTHDGYASTQAIVRISAANPRQSVNVGLRRR